MEQVDEREADWFRLADGVAAAGGLSLPVWLSAALSDALEVEPEWQELESYNQRVLAMLATLKQAMAKRPFPISFSVTIPASMTHQPTQYDLLAKLNEDGELTIEIVDS